MLGWGPVFSSTSWKGATLAERLRFLFRHTSDERKTTRHGSHHRFMTCESLHDDMRGKFDWLMTPGNKTYVLRIFVGFTYSPLQSWGLELLLTPAAHRIGSRPDRDAKTPRSFGYLALSKELNCWG
ncbi:hypothetical protein HBI25_061110 [Parastagonospora nodorum]|nr:hypothetical protein HBH52_071190 [Parastagonospora nodorum]KAH4023787.1 hypothetical protein HBI09_163970 [Parastagonospora nodorum]KAH4069764.1 hypothetical protein HBH50_104010 [Parastagonospora nodorum]KAH4090172.1 hypothetical protein HBH48_107780 [Parastagonospora nodorum]KAH4202150.1 hypothetical protein HBH42_014440 [Parastagonospora nodorum]